jgi:hypothetical protein
MNKYNLIPSTLKYGSAPATNQEIDLFLNEQQQELVEYDRSSTISLAQVYDDERQRSTTFRPTFKVSYIYANTITGISFYEPFRNNLYYVNPEESKITNIWKGYPQYYEFDFYRPPANDQHINYKSKSAYTYNWSYYLTYASENDSDYKMYYTSSNSGTINWTAKDGIPFYIRNSALNGSKIIEFVCVSPHGLSTGEYVELSFSYGTNNLFQVYSLGDGMAGSDNYIFTIFNVGYTGNTFTNKKTGTFKRVINPDNLTETKSKYYVRKHKVVSGVDDIIVSKNGFEKNFFVDEKKIEYSSITPNNITRISQKTSSDSYNFTLSNDLDISNLKDNQKRPITELYLTLIYRGYSGYFNKPINNVGLKQGWEFNLVTKNNFWWSSNNFLSNSNIGVNSYTKTGGITKTFFYNKTLNIGDTLDGDFCEWNDYEQLERVVSPYYQKIRFNNDVFNTTTLNDVNPPGYYYKPHQKMTLRVFSDYIEVANKGEVDNIPSYSYYSSADGQFRWRDLYTYGFRDNLERGVDYPFLNSAHYPFTDVVFRLIPEYVDLQPTIANFSNKPLIDGCE